jgi:hypothetical protein
MVWTSIGSALKFALFRKRRDFTVEIEMRDEKLTLSTVGLKTALAQDMQLILCPPKLSEPAERILTAIANYCIATPAAFQSGKKIGAKFVSGKQTLIEAFTFVSSRPDCLTICDLDENKPSFPKKLFASHFCAAAEVERPIESKMNMLALSIEVWPGSKIASSAPEADSAFNPNNHWAWFDFGCCLAEIGRPLEAIENWKVSACKWPRGALAAASPMFHEASTRKAKREGDVLVAEFWRSINQENIGRWCFERGIDVPASVLLSQAPAISKKHTKD